MKKRLLFSLLFASPTLIFAQTSRQFAELPRLYIGTDAYVRQENFIINDPGGQVADSDWMWNLSFGLNVGYRPTQWLAIETGVYRFTYANRIHMEYDFMRRSYMDPSAGPAIPLRVFVDPFAIKNQASKQLKLQLFTGFSWVNMRGSATRRGRYGEWVRKIGDPSEIVYPRFEANRRTINNHGFNIEVGVNLLYRFTNRLTGSATYGYTIGLKTIPQRSIVYQIDSFSAVHEATQSSKGSGQTVMIGLKYGFGKLNTLP